MMFLPIMMMMMSLMLWLALVVPPAFNSATNPGFFINIDCGSSKGFMDSSTGFEYDTDERYVDTGESRSVSDEVNYDYPNPFGSDLLKTLRVFPQGDRNCYVLKPEKKQEGENINNRYLIRAVFAYGNYDGKNETQSFSLYIGVNLWSDITLNPTKYNQGYSFREVIYTYNSTDDTGIHVCLVKTGSTIPFISALELRPLFNNNPIYPNHPITAGTQGRPPPLLLHYDRIDVSTPPTLGVTNNFARYTDDEYDRLWRFDPKFGNSGWYAVEAGIDVVIVDNNSNYKLPSQALRSAAQSLDVLSPLQYTVPIYGLDDVAVEYYVFFHFAEIESGKTRIISITLNNKPVFDSNNQGQALQYLKPVTVERKTQGPVQFTISAAPTSDAPPILNAFEIYTVVTDLVSPTYPQDVRAILAIKTAYQISRNWQGDPCLPIIYAWDRLNCSNATAAPPRIESLNLSSIGLTGKIHLSFSDLTELKSLDLSNNSLTGSVPEFLAELPKLQDLDLTGNKLSGSVPKALRAKEKAGTLKLSLDGNTDLCKEDSCERKKNFVLPLVASLSAIIVILLISLGLWIFKRPKVEAIRLGSNNKGSLKSKYRAFSYAEIVNITDNFKNIIGGGGFGKVYFGILQDHTEVAVKLLSPTSTQGDKEFLSEAQLLMTVHHRNLVCLVGYCYEGDSKALIYEYLAKGDLQKHLSKNPSALNWNERLNIAVDAAHGLHYLHNGCKPPVVHRDLKTSNILLDPDMRAKIGDFGLCRSFVNDVDSHISTKHIAGTPGYLDPEFHRTGNLNKKSDIYSFGIILFELITGQKAVIEEDDKKFTHILQRVIPILDRGDIQSTVDPRLQGEFSISSAWKTVEIGISCTSATADERPDISQILAELKECISLETDRSEGVSARVLESSSTLQIEAAPIAR